MAASLRWPASLITCTAATPSRMSASQIASAPTHGARSRLRSTRLTSESVLQMPGCNQRRRTLQGRYQDDFLTFDAKTASGAYRRRRAASDTYVRIMMFVRFLRETSLYLFLPRP